MALEYKISINHLTIPKSYKAEIIRKTVGIEDIAKEMAIKLGAYDETSILEFMQDFKKTIALFLDNGTSVNIEGLASFSHSIPGRLDNYDDPIIKDNITITCKPSASLVKSVKNKLSLTKVPSKEKKPTISSAMCTDTLNNEIGKVFAITGNNLKFKSNDITEGVFLQNTAPSTAHTPKRLNSYAGVSNTEIFAYNDIINNTNLTHEIEHKLSVRTRYTPNGSIREGVYDIPFREIRNMLYEGYLDISYIFYSRFENEHLNPVSIRDSNIGFSNNNLGRYNFSILLSTSHSGEIKEDSILTLTLKDITHSKSFTFRITSTQINPSTLQEVPRYSFIMDNISLQNESSDNEITSLELLFSNKFAQLWKMINFNYRGIIQEIINLNVILI